MSTPVRSQESFEAVPGNDMYPDLSSPAYPDTGNNGGATAPPAVSEEQKQEWNEELQRVEGEIATLRQVLASKVRYSAELKRKLGITPLQEIKHDFQLGLQSIKESAPYQRTNEALHDFNDKLQQTTAYQKTSAAAKSAAEKTSTVVAGIGRKLGDLRNSQTFKSVEGRVESAYASVKAKVSGSKSEGNFEEALQSEKENNGTIDPAKEAIPEEKQK
ncbi:hypothetical protein DPMN_069809 [Dreissena polymorpha]|uniref:Tumor protein D54 n=2 Tax=Dreissena polymorpha TaxID=45954 RepID=A0A9D3Z1V7_DREPO|nr:hypothetical protein DPMN_069809 [Dreissena polymorpha]